MMQIILKFNVLHLPCYRNQIIKGRSVLTLEVSIKNTLISPDYDIWNVIGFSPALIQRSLAKP